MGYDYKKISTNWNKFLAEGTLKAKEPEELFEEIKVVDKLKKMLLPSMLKNDVAMSLVKQGYKAVKDRKVNLNDLFKVVGALRLGFKTGDMSAAEDAMKQKGFLDKLGLQFSAGAITQNIKDASLEGQAGAKGRDAYVKAMAPEIGKKKDFGQTYGVQATMRFEEWLNADESVNLLTEEPNGVKNKANSKIPPKTGEQLLTMTINHVKDMKEKGKSNPIGSWGELARKIFEEAKRSVAKIIMKAGRGVITDIVLDEKALENVITTAAAKVIASSTAGQAAAPSR